jgi:hypothetical protein
MSGLACHTEQIFSEGSEVCVCKSVEFYQFLINVTVNQIKIKRKENHTGNYVYM